jgi:hypothetical protein
VVIFRLSGNAKQNTFAKNLLALQKTKRRLLTLEGSKIPLEIEVEALKDQLFGDR